MAFAKKTWTDRIAEFINRRTLTKEDGSTELVTVARSEGTISAEGDAFNAETMNDLEQRIAEEFDSLNTDLENLNTNLTNLSTEFTSDKAALATHKNSSDHDSRYYTKTQNDTLLNAKQDSLIFDTYVNTETANSNGSITLGIDISGYKLSQKPKCAFLQGQHVSFENYIFSYDNSTSTLAVFVVNYGTSYANTPITNRYGVMIIK